MAHKQDPPSYTAKDITVLEGLEPVRKRPGMYIGSTGSRGLHHLVREVLDNAVDEALAGKCTRIDIDLNADGSCTVRDDGRGIPVDTHDQLGIPAVTVVLTTLHAGGKFGGDGYKVSGGLHGVGVSVVNALSSRLDVEVRRDGFVWRQSFARGEPLGPLRKGDPARKTGTTVTFFPDADVFETVDFSWEWIYDHVRETAFLNRGLELRIADHRGAREERREETFRYNGGIVDFVKHLNSSRDIAHPHVIFYDATRDDAEVEVALQWNQGYSESVHSFANNINTTEGGTHEEGFRAALTKIVNDQARAKGFLKEKDDNLLGEDVREGLTAIISVRLKEPQFEGQTKTKLGNTDIRSFVQVATNTHLAEWLDKHTAETRAILQKALLASRARVEARKARELTRRKGLLESTSLPGKLSDCRSNDASRSELFIVEGNSAGGSAVKARDAEFQAVLPIRGKILNVEKARLAKILENKEVQALITAIGTGIGEEFDVGKARYHKIVILADADVDGSHIRTLLLTFFFRHMKEIIEQGYVYTAQPPLYGIPVGGQMTYVHSDRQRDAVLAAANGKKIGDIQRFKGLAEMDADQLAITTLDPTKRLLTQVGLEESALADEMIWTLMGEDVESRRNYIVRNAGDVRFLDV